MVSANKTRDQFVKAHKISDDIYISGMHYSGITIYNQQVRTLNLIYTLSSTGSLKPATQVRRNRQIVVIGGGATGVTAAVAFKKLGYRVSLLEEKSILLHLQHACTIRPIHPNLYLWPSREAMKPFTELPFCNWEANSASDVEKKLTSEFEKYKRSREGGTLSCFYDVRKCKVSSNSNSIQFQYGKKKTARLKYEFLFLATGFGVEKYVGKEEKTKSYWRNEDLSQLRLGDQVNKFLISGVGDGGISDVCRLCLKNFDPHFYVKLFGDIKLGRSSLTADLATIERINNRNGGFNYYNEFGNVYRRYSKPLKRLIETYKRTDVKEVVLNGREKEFYQILQKGKMSFINAWLIFLLNKNKLFKFHSGDFPDNCGQYIYDTSENKHHLIVRHGTAMNMPKLEELFSNTKIPLKEIKALQKQKRINEYSTRPNWDLNYWFDPMATTYKANKYIVSPKLVELTAVYLDTLNGLVKNYLSEISYEGVEFRITMHRLISISAQKYFQQITPYVGTRKGEAIDVGRAFPLEEGLVGLAMRTNTCFSLIQPRVGNQPLFAYERIFARPLRNSTDSFLLVPVSVKDRYGSVLCLYLDTSSDRLVIDEYLRKLVYWTLTSFIRKVEEVNVSDRELTRRLADKRSGSIDKNVSHVPGLSNHSNEMIEYQNRGQLIMSSNKLIDYYEE